MYLRLAQNEFFNRPTCRDDFGDSWATLLALSSYEDYLGTPELLAAAKKGSTLGTATTSSLKGNSSLKGKPPNQLADHCMRERCAELLSKE